MGQEEKGGGGGKWGDGEMRTGKGEENKWRLLYTSIRIYIIIIIILIFSNFLFIFNNT